jgi:hypothetical protein
MSIMSILRYFPLTDLSLKLLERADVRRIS